MPRNRQGRKAASALGSEACGLRGQPVPYPCRFSPRTSDGKTKLADPLDEPMYKPSAWPKKIPIKSEKFSVWGKLFLRLRRVVPRIVRRLIP